MSRSPHQRHRARRGAARIENAAEPGLVPGRASRTEALRVQQKRRAKGSKRARSDEVQAKAAQGVRGAGGPLPHGDEIQASFGRHDVSGVRAHVGGGAASAAGAIGAEAYATGSDVAFAKPPDVHTAAHEAAHVVQQRGGVQLKGGVGEAGDRYERHADAVADAVVRRQSAEGLLDRAPGGAGGAGVQGLFGDDEEGEEEPGTAVSWIVEQIDDAGALIEHLGSVSDDVARQVIRALASVNRQILVSFLLASPAHQFALYAARQLPVDELISLAVQGQQALRGVIVGAVRALGQLVTFYARLYTQAPQVACECAHELQTDLLPSVLQSCSELGYDLFYEWWPANTGLEARVTLTAGAEVPVWPEPPISVGGEGQLQGELKLYNKDGDGAPKLEFEIGGRAQRETSAGIEVPEVASVGGSRTMSLASSLQTSTRFADIEWHTGLINALQSANHAAVLEALCAGMGNVASATQFQVTLKASAEQGVSAEAGLGDMASATVEQAMGLGLQLQVQTPTETQDGKIEAQGTLSASMGAEAGLNIPGGDNLGPMISYFAGNAGAGASAQAQIGGRLKWRIPKSDITEMDPDFEYVELFVGGQAGGHVARESMTVSGEGSIGFDAEGLANFEVPDVSDGMTVTELENALPFRHLGLKGSVEIHTFVWDSVHKLKVDLHGSTTHGTPDIPIDDIEVSGSARLRAGYSAEYENDDIQEGVEAAQAYLERVLPENLAGMLRGG